jgi:hypothetical protein
MKYALYLLYSSPSIEFFISNCYLILELDNLESIFLLEDIVGQIIIYSSFILFFFLYWLIISPPLYVYYETINPYMFYTVIVGP